MRGPFLMMYMILFIMMLGMNLSCGKEAATTAMDEDPPPAANVPAAPMAQKSADNDAVPPIKETVDRFCEAYFKGHLKAITPFYADKVLLEQYSQLLTPEFGLVKEDTGRAAKTVTRDALIAAYGRFIEKVTLEKWQKVWGNVSDNRISITPEAGMQHLAIRPGRSNDTMHYKFLYNRDAGKWEIVAEQTDF